MREYQTEQCLLCLQDGSLIWGHRALQALKGIASHPVSFDFARAAAAPVASRQLAQAWQAFTSAVSRDTSPSDDVHTAAQAVDVADTDPVASPAAAVKAAAEAAMANASMSRGIAVSEAGAGAKENDPSDDADDEEVTYACKRLIYLLSSLSLSTYLLVSS